MINNEDRILDLIEQTDDIWDLIIKDLDKEKRDIFLKYTENVKNVCKKSLTEIIDLKKIPERDFKYWQIRSKINGFRSSALFENWHEGISYARKLHEDNEEGGELVKVNCFYQTPWEV